MPRNSMPTFGVVDQLSDDDLKRQDEVDSACYCLLCSLAKGSDVPWDIEAIATVRDAVQDVLYDRFHIMSPQELYPYLEG